MPTLQVCPVCVATAIVANAPALAAAIGGIAALKLSFARQGVECKADELGELHSQKPPAGRKPPRPQQAARVHRLPKYTREWEEVDW